MAALGRLGVQESYGGCERATTKQRFGGGSLEVAARLLRDWGVTEVGPTALEISDTQLTLRDPQGSPVLQARVGSRGELWMHVDPDACTWAWSPGRPLLVQLAKRADCLGSWPRLFRRLAPAPALAAGGKAAPPDAAEAWDPEEALRQLEQARAEHQLLRDDFLQSAVKQLAAPPQDDEEPQEVLMLPSEPAACAALLAACAHAPRVAALLRLAHQLAGVDLAPVLAAAAAAQSAKRASGGGTRRSCGIDGGGSPPGDAASIVSSPAEEAVLCLVAGLAAVERHAQTHGLGAVAAAGGCLGAGCGEYATAVVAGCLGVREALVLAQASVDHTSFTDTAAGAAGLARQQAVLDRLPLRPPHIAAYSGATAAPYATISALRAELLAAARAPAAPALLRAALVARGCVPVELGQLLEEGAEEGAEGGEEKELPAVAEGDEEGNAGGTA
eukprot:scaffold11.g4018.t1